MLVAAYLDTIIEHHSSIELLIANGFYGSAFALARPISDSALRGLWVARCASDEDVEQLCSSEDHHGRIPHGEKLRNQLDRAYESETYFRDASAEWRTLSSYTHSGLRQLGRRGFLGGRPDGYSAWSIVQVVDLCTVWLIILAKLYFRLAGGNEWALVVQVLHDIYVDKERTPLLYALANASNLS